MAYRTYRRVDSVHAASRSSVSDDKTSFARSLPSRARNFCVLARKTLPVFLSPLLSLGGMMRSEKKRRKLVASILTFVMIFQTIAGVFVPVSIFNLKKQEAYAGWLDMGYGYRKLITIDHTKVAGDLTNFPVLINLTDTNLKTTANGGRVTSAEGFDIIFSNAAGTEKYDHEIEKYDAATGSIVMWVKVPNLSSAIDTTLYIYYGNASITTSQEDKPGVWDDGGNNNFKGVWHMKETGTGQAADFKDSTQYANHSINTTNQPAVTASGQIGSGEGFINAAGNYINVGNGGNISPVSAITISAWIKKDYTSSGIYRGVVGKYRLLGGTTSYRLGAWGDRARLDLYGLSDTTTETPSGSYSSTNWTYIVGKYDGSNKYLYINGSFVVSEASVGNINTNEKNLVIGGDGDGSSGGTEVGNAFGGLLDEVRISNTARSAQWIATEYNNQSNPTEFSSLGIEEVASPPALSSFAYRKAITIDHTKVTGDLVNFPVLINLPTDASLAAHAQADGDDILFTSSSVAWNTGTANDKLAHEVEKYTTATGELVAWVKIPNLSSAVDTVIYMYYGNGSIASQQNKTAVWDSSTKGVWHLKETGAGGAGDFKDSTQYGNNSMNAASQPVTGAGQIGNSQAFNGTGQHIDLGDNSLLNSFSEITVEGWVKTNYKAATQVLVEKHNNPSGQGYNLLATAPNGYFEGRLYPGARGSSTIITDGVWHHLVMTNKMGTNNWKLYSDGAQIAQGDGVAYTPVTDGGKLYIGARDAGVSLPTNGAIDEVRISSTARSAQWISTEYNNQSQPTEFSSLGIEEVSSPTALSSFGYRKAITIDHTKVAGDLTNFPVLINLPSDASLASHAQNDADDIMFTSSNVAWNTGTVNDKLAHEVEKYTTATGELVAWVKIPNLSSATDTVIYMYYGNNSVTLTSQQNKTAVWDSNTKMVQHMNQNPGGTAPQMLDSTQHRTDGTSYGGMSVANSVMGQVDGSTSFDGTDDYVNINKSLSINPNSFTISHWIKTSSAIAGLFTVNNTTTANGFRFGLKNGYLSFLIGDGVSGPGGHYNESQGSLFVSDGSWHLISGIFNRTSLTFTGYVDGVASFSQPLSSDYPYMSQAAPNIGKYSTIFFPGSIDELHISNVVRSAQWISTEYNNQSKPTEFATLGIEEVSSPTALSSFGYRKAITIDHTKVTGDLVNFPVLINLPTDASLAAHAQASGNDILFTSSNTAWNTGTANDKLAHEVEKYTTASGELVAWVKIPNLSSTVDTTIYMYYGNCSVTSQQNKTAVWDSNTKGVWHLKETGMGAAQDYKDSSQYANHSTNTTGQPTVNSAGQIGNAESFDGTSKSIALEKTVSLTKNFTLDWWSKGSGEGVIGSYASNKVYVNNGSFGIVGYYGGVWRTYSFTPTSLNTNDWHRYSLVFDGSVLTGYLDGLKIRDLTVDTATNVTVLYLGKNAYWPNYFNGSIDEVRIANTARSAQWISTEYQNQSKPTEFATLGIEEVSNAPALSSFGYRKAITIDHTKVAGNLTNFPVLINLPSDASLAGHAQADADDILFTSSSTAWNTGTANDKLAHEIEKYTAATGELMAWVKIPNLSSTVDTTLYIYYGNAAVTSSQENKTAVWDSSTKGAWHLKETGTGAAGDYKDSTQYANNSLNTASQPAAATGQIDGAEGFDGVDDYVNVGTGSALDTGQYETVEAWVKPTGAQEGGFGGIYGDGSTDRRILVNNYGGLLAQYKIGDTVYSAVTSSGSVPLNEWTHVVFTYNGAEAVFWVNGIKRSPVAATGVIKKPQYFSRIGWGHNVTYHFNGAIDEVRVSNIVRSAAWIATEYANQSVPLKTEAAPAGFLSVGSETIYRLEITGAASQTAGGSQTITLTAKDAAGNTMTGYDGDAAVVFSGASASPRGTAPTCRDKDGNDIAFGSNTVLTFANGTASCLLKLYKAENANVSVSSMSTLATGLAVNVSSGAFDNFLVEAPASTDAGASFGATITARDYEYNTVSVSGTTALSVNAGTISPASLSAASFTGGVWSGNLSVSGIVERPVVTITATNGSSTGTDSISVLGIPQVPGSVSASRTTDYSIAVTWQDLSTVETGYRIERKMDSGSGFGAYMEIGTVGENISTFTDNAASNPADMPLPDRAYQYRVRAYNSLGSSAYGEDATIHYTTPGTPSGVAAARLSDASFAVSYVDNAAVTDTHRIGRCSGDNCDGTYETVLGTFAASPQTDASAIAPDSRYRYRVRSETPDSLASPYAVSNYEYTTPDAPTIGTTGVSAAELTVHWTDNSAYEDGFRIEVSVDGGAYQEITPNTNTVGANIHSYAYTGAADHNYKFRVRSHIGATSHNGELFSVYSGESTPAYTSAAAPAMGSPVVDSSASITWHWTDSSTFEESFHLHFTLGAGADVNDIPANSTGWTTTALLPNTRYQTHVHAYRADRGESAASADSSAIYTLSNVPTDLSAVSDAQNRITVGWGANSNPAGTEYYAENIGTGENSGWITASSWTTGILPCGIEYSFRVKARNGDGVETAYSGSVVAAAMSCGMAVPAGFQNPPKPPEVSADNPAGDFKLLINGGEDSAARPVVRLTLLAGSDTERMALSNSADFSDASVVPYQKEVRWDLLQGLAAGAKDGNYTVYARFYTRYGVSSPVVKDSIALDTTAPALTLGALKGSYLVTESVIITGSTESNAKVIYNLDSRRAGVIDAGADGRLRLDLGILSEGTHSLQLVVRDILGNSSPTLQLFLEVRKPAAISPSAPPAPSSPTAPVPPRPPISPAPAAPAPSVSGTPASPIPAVPTPSIPASPTPGAPAAPEEVSRPGLNAPTTEAPGMPDASTPSPDLDTGDISPETPVSMLGDWNLLTFKPFPKDTTAEDVRLIIEKFPEFRDIFHELGYSDLSDAQSLQSANLDIPGLSEVMGLNSAELSAPNLPAINTPLTELAAQFKKEIPSNIVFVRTKDDSLDVASALSFENGMANQKVSLLAGQSFQLILRPDLEVDAVQGYLTFRARDVARGKETGPFDKVATLLGFGKTALAQEEIEEKLVLSEFAYRDEDGDGIWTADVTTPLVSGEYEVITVLDYKDINLGMKTLRLITVVDPEGYVYRVESDGAQARIPEATVSLYWFDAATNRYELWDAERYQQQNPQVTDARGTYSFLVPPGSYYLEVSAAGYLPYRSDPFDVTVGSGVHMNLELHRAISWKERLAWQNVLLVIFGISLFYNFYSDRKERKRRKKAEEMKG